VDPFEADAPFTRWPIQPGGRSVYGVAWYTRPAAFITQAHIEHGTVASAMLTETVIDRMIARYPAEIAAAKGLLVVHDWRRVTSFDPGVIRFYADRLNTRNRSAIRAIILGVKMSALSRIAMQAAGGTIARVHGLELELSSDLASMLVKYNVQRPDGTLVLD
jgi:phosphoglucomutase